MISVLILAAGNSSRMNSRYSKILHYLGGRRIIDYILEIGLSITKDVHIVISEQLKKYFSDNMSTVQKKPKGTGDAALIGMKECKHDNVLIIFGDTPLLTKITIEEMYLFHMNNKNDITISSTYAPDKKYGIINLDDNNNVESIIETKNEKIDFNTDHILHNGGVMCVKKELVIDILQHRVGEMNNEKLLTSIIFEAYQMKKSIQLFDIDFEETIGINTRYDLAKAEKILQDKWRKQIMQNNTVIDVNTLYLSYDTEISDSVIHPFVVIGPGVKIKNSEVLAHSYIANSSLNECNVGPFVSIKNSDIQHNVTIGNFTEIQRSTIKQKTKIKHLSYIGDCNIEASTNIGAGTIICNYDGMNKHQTSIGSNTMIGANNSLVAPLTIGNNVKTGAGSTITRDINDNTLSISRAEQIDRCVD